MSRTLSTAYQFALEEISGEPLPDMLEAVRTDRGFINRVKLRYPLRASVIGLQSIDPQFSLPDPTEALIVPHLWSSNDGQFVYGSVPLNITAANLSTVLEDMMSAHNEQVLLGKEELHRMALSFRTALESIEKIGSTLYFVSLRMLQVLPISSRRNFTSEIAYAKALLDSDLWWSGYAGAKLLVRIVDDLSKFL